MNTLHYEGLKIVSGKSEQVSDPLTIEHPLSVSINGEPFTLTMQTPGNELELVRGLLFTEGIYKKRSGQLNTEVKEKSDHGFISSVDVHLESDEFDTSLINKRNLLSAASCGICGTTELKLPEGEKLESSGILELVRIRELFTTMESHQTAFIHSGGCHAASVFDKDFDMLTIMEDIGRHNAVDKVIGSLLNQGKLKEARYLLVSGRVSYEIITKCFAAGIPNLLAVSAPSSLAVDFAKELGITLYGFCRNDRATVYAAR
jgi:FdhD protein